MFWASGQKGSKGSKWQFAAWELGVQSGGTQTDLSGKGLAGRARSD